MPSPVFFGTSNEYDVGKRELVEEEAEMGNVWIEAERGEEGKSAGSYSCSYSRAVPGNWCPLVTSEPARYMREDEGVGWEGEPAMEEREAARLSRPRTGYA